MTLTSARESAIASAAQNSPIHTTSSLLYQTGSAVAIILALALLIKALTSLVKASRD